MGFEMSVSRTGNRAGASGRKCDHGLMPDRPPLTTPTAVLRMSPVALLAVLFTVLGLSPAILADPALFGWLTLAPALAAAWVLRARTTADVRGLRVRGLWSSRTVEWERVSGVRFARRRSGRFGRFGVAVLTDSSELRLPCVTFRDLPALALASAGRIPDPFAALAATEK